MQSISDIDFAYVNANGVRLHVATAGPADGKPLILLHGFPEFWYGWRHQIPKLAEAGFRLLVPDQRGYNLSAKPRGVSSYRLDRLAGDILALADHAGARRFCLAGHDWGAIVGWWLAEHHPQRVERFVALSAGHPAVWRARMQSDPEQKKRSRYVRWMQAPLLPEARMRARNYKALADAVSDTAETGAVGKDDLIRYREAWDRERALTAMVNWYRAVRGERFKPLKQTRIAVPTQTIWGARDKYGTLGVAEDSVALCDRGRLVVLDDATHWVLTDEAERVTDHLKRFFGE